MRFVLKKTTPSQLVTLFTEERYIRPITVTEPLCYNLTNSSDYLQLHQTEELISDRP